MNPISLQFATPIFRARLEGIDELNLRLEKLILSLEDETHRKKQSPQEMHQNVFESDFDFLKRDEAEVKALRDIFFQNLAAFLKQVAHITDDQIAKLRFNNHCWFHITRGGGYFQPHNHPMASWSIVYYVNPGDDDVEDPRAAGHIVFMDPRGHADAYLDPANKNLKREMAFSSIRIRPKTCEMLIFPSYMIHYVEPYSGQVPRIVVASNFWFFE